MQNNIIEFKTKSKSSQNLFALKIFLSAFFVLLSFIGGIFTAHSDWFNKNFDKKYEQMQNSNPVGLDSYKNEYNNFKSQSESNIISNKNYEEFHKYYKKVVERIKKFDGYWDDNNKTAIISYIDGYGKRKQEMEYVLFPCMDNPKWCENSYGTIFGTLYPKGMLEFDRQELLMYRMILQHMYIGVKDEDIELIFAK